MWVTVPSGLPVLKGLAVLGHHPDGITTIFLKTILNHFMDGYLQLSPKAPEKVDVVLKLITTVKQVPEKFLKHLSGTDGLFEVRVEYQSNCFRIFGCFDEGKLVILLNAFVKNTDKIPRREIDKADHLPKKYFSSNSFISQFVVLINTHLKIGG